MQSGQRLSPPERDSGTLRGPSHTLQNLLLLSDRCPGKACDSATGVRAGPGQAGQVQACPDPKCLTPQSLRDPLLTEEQVTVLRTRVPLRIGKWVRHLATAIQLLHHPIR